MAAFFTACSENFAGKAILRWQPSFPSAVKIVSIPLLFLIGPVLAKGPARGVA
jgi:hypothetical protein